jgi:hypothetical protein
MAARRQVRAMTVIAWSALALGVLAVAATSS